MQTVDEIARHYRFSPEDEKNLAELGQILLPHSDQLANDFYGFLLEDPYTAAFFETEQAIRTRKETLKAWFRDLFTSRYDHLYVLRLERIGKVHVKIGLKGHYVNAAMNFIRSFCQRYVVAHVPEDSRKEELLATLHKALDINLDVMTSSYREAELKKVFLSYKVESTLIRWAERLLHGLNLVLMIGLLVMAVGVVGLLVSDVFSALTTNLEHGVIKALGSLLVLWMMIELLHTEVSNLRGGKFHVRIFIELALVAFIRKLFVATLEHKDPITFGLLLGGLLTLGVIYFLISKAEGRTPK